MLLANNRCLHGGWRGSTPRRTRPSLSLASTCMSLTVQGSSRRAHQRALVALASSSTGGDNQPDDELWEKGLQEARQLLVMSVKLAQQETRQQMEELFYTDQDGPTTSRNLDQFVHFWTEQGASPKLARDIVKDMQFLPARCWNITYLASKLARLRRLLPSDVVGLVARDVLVLSADLNEAVKNLIVLVEHFPGAEVCEIVERRPRLLYTSTEELTARLEQCDALLVKALPGWVKPKVRQRLLVENPELLFRLEHHAGKEFPELPVDIQNMVIAATGGNWWATT